MMKQVISERTLNQKMVIIMGGISKVRRWGGEGRRGAEREEREERSGELCDYW